MNDARLDTNSGGDAMRGFAIWIAFMAVMFAAAAGIAWVLT